MCWRDINMMMLEMFWKQLGPLLSRMGWPMAAAAAWYGWRELVKMSRSLVWCELVGETPDSDSKTVHLLV